ncbi:hypothetical protein DYB35_010010 [Aphanomyces astaci]|uniref:Uncharacterized protein n=1 Tax=Aphanomyces astaci TaxID=112090 RepID=A0A418DWU5_APHAT|nr:hypothetical protein DYB35_010010 [Aphanomyces astaci]
MSIQPPPVPTTGTATYVFDPWMTGGVSGSIITDVGAVSTSIKADLDLTDADWAALTAFDGNCTSVAVTDFAWHIHTQWNNNENHSSGLTNDCAIANTANHFDPNFACGPNSDNIKSPQCANKTYGCNATLYANNPDVCEKGDLSGKLGKMKAVNGKIAATWIDKGNYPTVAEHKITWNIVLHAVCGTATPRFVCAKIDTLSMDNNTSSITTVRPTPAALSWEPPLESFLSVLEVFAEHGYQLFHSPEAVYADFRSSGIFRRSGVDATSASTSRLHQREALFDVALSHGLSSVIAVYVLAPQDDSNPTSSFLLQEPVAVQSWVRSHVDRARGAKSPEELQATLRQLRGLRHIVHALVERLQRGHEATPSSFHASTESWNMIPSGDDGSMAYLSSLQDELTSVERLAEFTLWLHRHLDDSSTFNVSTPSTMLRTIVASAGLVDLLPLPADVSHLFAHFHGRVDSLTFGAIMLFLTLQTHQPRALLSWDALQSFALDAAAPALHLPRAHAAHVLALWAIDHASYDRNSSFLHSAVAILRRSPPEYMDPDILIAVLDVLLQLNQPDLAHSMLTSNDEEADDLTHLLLVVDTYLRLDAWPLAWLAARRAPRHIAATMPRLVAFHQSRGNLRDVLLSMTWTPAEMAIWKHLHLPPADLALLHLYGHRGEFHQASAVMPATDNAAWLRQHHDLLLRTVARDAPEVDVHVPHAAGKDHHSKKEYHPSPPRPSIAATAATTLWPKPSKDQYEVFFNPPTLPTNAAIISSGNEKLPSAFSLHVKKPVSTPHAGSVSPGQPPRPLAASTEDSSEVVLPYQWLSTDLTRGPHSSSASKVKRANAYDEQGKSLEPAARDSKSPPRTPHHEAQSSLPARRNPVRDVRKKH